MMGKVVQWFGILLGVVVMADRVAVDEEEEEAKRVLGGRGRDLHPVYVEASCGGADGCSLD